MVRSPRRNGPPPIIMVLLMLGTSLVLITPASPPAAAASYVVEFDGQTYTELADPLARFASFPVSENPGETGIVTLTPLSVEANAWTNASLTATNAEIDALLPQFGISRSYAAAQVSTMLEYNSSYDAIRETAVAQIQAGLFREAEATLGDSPVQIIIYCAEFRYVWYIGVPTPAHCTGGTAADIHFLATITSLEVSGTQLNGIDIALDIRGISIVTLGQHIMGVGYRPVSTLVEGTFGNEVSGGIYSDVFRIGSATTGWINFQDLLSSSPAGEAQINRPFVSTDRIYFSLGSLRASEAKTVTGIFTAGTQTFQIAWEYMSNSPGWWVKAHIQAGQFALGRLQLYMPFTTAQCDRVEAEFTKYPPSFKFSYEQESMVAELGTKHIISIDRQGSNQAIFDMEAKATYTKNCSPEATIQFVGFPSRLDLRLDLGGGSVNKIKSADLSKDDYSVNGYFRTIVFTAHAAGLRLDGTIADVNRVNIVFGKDIFDGDGDRFGMLGGNFEKCVAGTSGGSIIARDVPTIGTGGMALKPDSPCSTTYRYTVSIQDLLGCPSPISGCDLAKGAVREDPDTIWFNAWWWAIPDVDVGDGTCFRTESFSCP